MLKIKAAAVGATILLGTVVAHAQTPIPPAPADFLMATSQSDNYEINAARSAIAESHDSRVVSFAHMMIADHSKMSAAMRSAGEASHLPLPPPGMNGDQSVWLSALQSARGAEFDKTYVHQQILAHQQAEAVVGSFAKSGSDANLRKAAQSGLPTIDQHLKMAQKLAGEIGSH